MSSVATIDGIVSNLDYTSMITAMADARRVPITLIKERATAQSDLLAAYQSITTQVNALRSTAETLVDGTLLQARSVKVSDSTRLIATAGAGTAVGDYEIDIRQLATAHKISSGVVADHNADLGYTGDIILNGKTISLRASDDLVAFKDAISASGAGVSASIITVSSTEHRLILRSQKTGADNAIQIADAAGSGFLQGLGLVAGAATAKHAITNGVASDYLGDATKAVGTVLGLSAPSAGSIEINGTEVAVDLGQDTLQEIAERIGSTVSGVSATVTSSNGKYRLELTGASTPTLADAGGILETLGVLHQDVANELEVAKDAIIKVDGFTVQRASNSIDDAIAGLSLDLLEAQPDDVATVTVNPNTSSAVTAVQNLVTSYNNIISTLNAGQQFDTDTNEGGILFGETTILSLQTGLHEQAMRSVSTLGGALTGMAQIGLQTDRYGQLALNTATLQEALEDDPTGVLRLLTTEGEASDADVEYVSSGTSTDDSGGSGFAVNITQLATKATATGDALAAGIQQNETLTINGKYTVQLTAGMTVQAAADKLNQILDGNRVGMHASVVDQKLQIQSNFYGSNYAVSISSSLADGAGGTGLGGATAGTSVTVYGQNVAGTIGGLKAEGWGQWLTGSEGAARDLKIQVSGTTTGSRGVVKVSQGLASRLRNYTSEITDASEGMLTHTSTSITDNIKALKEDADEMEEGVQDYIEQLKTKFSSLEALIAKNKIMLQYVTGEITTLSGSSVDEEA